MKKRVVTLVIVVSLLLTLMAIQEKEDAKAETKKVITIGTLQIDEETEYSFQNAYATTYDDGWYMNVKGGNSANGTQVNVYQLDMTQPVTQRFKFTIVDEKEGVVRISPAYAEDKYLDVRRYGKPFAVGQKIALWENDNDPLKLKDIYLDFQEDGSLYFY